VYHSTLGWRVITKKKKVSDHYSPLSRRRSGSGVVSTIQCTVWSFAGAMIMLDTGGARGIKWLRVPACSGTLNQADTLNHSGARMVEGVCLFGQISQRARASRDVIFRSATLEATQGQILSQPPNDATSSR